MVHLSPDQGYSTPSALCVALVVGDTVGHTHPALAVAEALRALSPQVSVVFFGIGDSAAASIVMRAGHPFVAVPGNPIRRASVAGLARAAVSTLQAVGVARRTLREHGVHMAMGFGSFVTGGVLLAARQLGIPTMILEANVEFGLANRWLRPVVDRVVLGLAVSGDSAVGVPVRRAVQVVGRDGVVPRGDTFRILVASGSRGAAFLAARVPEVVCHLQAAGRRLEVWQQAPQPALVRQQYAAAGVDAIVEPFIEHMAAAYAWADVAITRAGASTIAELAAVGVPALLVPLEDASANHQAANADAWQRAGAGVALTEREWTVERASGWLSRMRSDPPAWQASSSAARRLARPDAASHIAGLCLQMARSPRG